MPTLANHQSKDYVKLLLLGDAKTGKTGSLVSLVKAGYKLAILDFDNLLDVLSFYVQKECPDKLDNVHFRSLRDERKATKLGYIIDGQPKAFIRGIEMLDHWKYTEEDGTQVDLGHPWKWGPEWILVIDSLSRLCDAAYDFREPLTPKGDSGKADGRATYGDAQDAVENTLAEITGDAFKTNVIVICHGIYMDTAEGSQKIFPQGVGQKLSPKIPQYFPNYIRYKNVAGKRTIQLNSDPMIDLANTRPFAFEGKTLPIETGLAEIFSTLLGDRKPKEKQAQAPIARIQSLRK